jgi:excisionase family DNA binding protein
MKMLTPAEVAERLNISYDTALRMIKTSGIAYLKIGRQYRVNEAVINELTSQGEVVIVDFEEAG